MSFLSTLKSLSISSSLPFNLDFSLKSRNEPKNKTFFLDIEIPLYGSLLVREKVFLESYLLDIQKKRNAVELEIEKLAYELNKTLALNSMKVARAAVNGGYELPKKPTEEDTRVKKLVDSLLVDESYQEWKAKNIESFVAILTQISEISSESTRDTFLVTVFLASRTFGNWDLEDTMYLTSQELSEILEVYYSEFATKDATDDAAISSKPDEVIDLGKD
jgi:hypothetical protein